MGNAAANLVGGTVSEKLSMTEQLLKSMEQFIETRGVDILQAVVVFVVGYLICREIKVCTRHVLSKSRMNPSGIGFITETIYFIALAITLVISLGIAGISSSSLLAALGGMGLAVGLALKDNFSNVASGIFILLFRPFSVGDYIETSAIEGEVREISVMYTRIKTLGNQMIVIPNNMMTSSVIKNYSHYALRNVETVIDVGYDTELEECLLLLREVLQENKYVQNKDQIALHIQDMADSAITIYMRCEVNASEYFEARTSILIDVKKALDAAGIDIPYPQLVVHRAKN